MPPGEVDAVQEEKAMQAEHRGDATCVGWAEFGNCEHLCPASCTVFLETERKMASPLSVGEDGRREDGLAHLHEPIFFRHGPPGCHGYLLI